MNGPYTVTKRPFHQKRKHQNNLTYRIKGIVSIYPWENRIEGVPIDATIAPLIAHFCTLGYLTGVSCSGLPQDHPDQGHEGAGGYIGFELLPKAPTLLLQELFAAAGWKEAAITPNWLCFYTHSYDPILNDIVDRDNKTLNQRTVLRCWLNVFMLAHTLPPRKILRN